MLHLRGVQWGWAAVLWLLFFFLTYHRCFCNRTKAVDENVAADIHWWTCMTNRDWNSSSPCAYKTKYFHSVVLKPIVGTGWLRGKYGNKVWVIWFSLVLVLKPVWHQTMLLLHVSSPVWESVYGSLLWTVLVKSNHRITARQDSFLHILTLLYGWPAHLEHDSSVSQKEAKRLLKGMYF